MLGCLRRRQCNPLSALSREPVLSDKRKKEKFAAKRERRHLKQTAEEGRLENGLELPQGAVAADKSKQVPNNSYSPPPMPHYRFDTSIDDDEPGNPFR